MSENDYIVRFAHAEPISNLIVNGFDFRKEIYHILSTRLDKHASDILAQEITDMMIIKMRLIQGAE